MNESDSPPVRSRRRADQTRRYPTRLRAKAIELLSDGKWHNYEKVVAALTPMVPPGVAYRKTEATRVSLSKSKGPRVRARETNDIIRTGARTVVKEMLRWRQFEIYPTGRLDDPSKRQIRYIPLTAPPVGPEDFTPLQLQVAALFAVGLSPIEVSRRLNLRVNPVNPNRNAATHFVNALGKKLGCSGMAEVVFRMRQLGVLADPGPIAGVEFQVACAVIARPSMAEPHFVVSYTKLDEVTVRHAWQRLKNRYPHVKRARGLVPVLAEELKIEFQERPRTARTLELRALRAARQQAQQQ